MDSIEIRWPSRKPFEKKPRHRPTVATLEGFIAMDDENLTLLYEQLSLAMSKEDFFFTRDYFRKEQRDPTITEIKVLDTYWSDHCRHTTFMTVIDDVIFKPGFYMSPIIEAWKDYNETRNFVYAGKGSKNRFVSWILLTWQ